MTNEEAIKQLLKERFSVFCDICECKATCGGKCEPTEAYDMAIEALKAPTGLISKKDVKWQIQEWINELNEAIDMLDSIPSAEPPVLTCDGCRHIGTYDTDFPCSGCIRREKDYYEQER